MVGKTGSGKSTLAQLLPRLANTPSGSIFLDGTDITSATASFNVFSVNDAPELTTASADIDLGSVEEDLGYKGDEEDIIEQGTAALELNPFVITEAQLDRVVEILSDSIRAVLG